MTDTEKDGPKTFKVPECNLPTLRDRIAKLNKKATKLACAEIVINILSEIEVPIEERDEFTGRQRVIGHRKVFELTVTGAAPKINGWEFIAVVQPTCNEEGVQLGNILRGVPGASCEVPVEYRLATNNCDHCKTSRRRTETFILHSDAGETKQVGRNCLRDFLGHTSPEVLCSIAQMLMDAEDYASDSERDEFGGGRGGAQYFNAEEILALAACSVRLNGWRSNKTAQEFGSLSTSGEVGNWIFTKAEQRKQWEKPLMTADEDKATAHEVAEWMATLSERSDLNDYMYNLSVLGQGATFSTKNFGLACSAIPVYLREMEREINRRKKFEADLSSQYVGTVGERSTFTATLVYTTDLESQFGVTHLYKFKDEAGNILVWFASNVFYNNKRGQDIDLGDTVKFDATVKGHEEYKGIKQTMITRAVWWVSKEEKKAAAKARKAERAAEKAIIDANVAAEKERIDAMVKAALEGQKGLAGNEATA